MEIEIYWEFFIQNAGKCWILVKKRHTKNIGPLNVDKINIVCFSDNHSIIFETFWFRIVKLATHKLVEVDFSVPDNFKIRFTFM